MNRASVVKLRAALSTLVLAAAFGCVSYPAEYVPPDKVVFLRQPYFLTPVRYEAESADPYAWDIDIPIDKAKPSILSALDFSAFLKPDLNLDAKTYKETKEHLLLMKDDPVYNDLRTRLNGLSVEAPAPRTVAKGEVTRKYSNGTEYAYPGEPGATIMFFDSGDVKITFADGRQYFGKSNGDFFERDAPGTELYAFFAKDSSFRRRVGNGLYSQSPEWRSLESDTGTIEKQSVPVPQYAFTPSGANYKYVFFVGDFSREKLADIALIHDNSLRFDYLPDTDTVLVVSREKEAIVLESGLTKSHRYFNARTRKPEDLYSYYFPEGIRIADVNRPLTYSEVIPNWPERYKEKKIGPFRILYTEKDGALLGRLDAAKLSEAYAAVTRATGLQISADRVIVLPPDLRSYRRLHAQAKNEKLLWYPSGFETKDIVVMWPPSLPRYEGDEGDRYFWDTELYEILSHELTHLAVGEATGVFSPVPVWLNEGLAVYTESRYSAEVKKYWDVTFSVCRSEGKAIDWDLAAAFATSEFSVDRARTDYAQSYKMVEYLAERFGMKSVIAYLVSFKLPYERIQDADIKTSYKENFRNTFRVSWEDNLAGFEEFCRNGKK
jgi:hypothetical protein